MISASTRRRHTLAVSTSRRSPLAKVQNNQSMQWSRLESDVLSQRFASAASLLVRGTMQDVPRSKAFLDHSIQSRQSRTKYPCRNPMRTCPHSPTIAQSSRETNQESYSRILPSGRSGYGMLLAPIPVPCRMSSMMKVYPRVGSFDCCAVKVYRRPGSSGWCPKGTSFRTSLVRSTLAYLTSLHSRCLEDLMSEPSRQEPSKPNRAWLSIVGMFPPGMRSNFRNQLIASGVVVAPL
jgi:hypothetical protein